jgi:hypothetical protein
MGLILYECKKKHKTKNENKPPNVEHWDVAAVQPVAKWKKKVNYVIGSRADYKKKVYDCILAHLSDTGLEPDSSPTLWTEDKKANVGVSSK